MCLSWLLSQEHDGTDSPSVRRVVSVPTAAAHLKLPHGATGSTGFGLGVRRRALWLPTHLCLSPGSSHPPKPHFFVFSGAEMSEALIFVSPFTNPPPPRRTWQGT